MALLLGLENHRHTQAQEVAAEATHVNRRQASDIITSNL